MRNQLEKMTEKYTTMKNSFPEIDSNIGTCQFCGKELERNDWFKEHFKYCECEETQKYIEALRKVVDLKNYIETIEWNIEYTTKTAEQLLERSNLGRRFKTRTFETFDKTKNEEAYKKTFEYADSFDANDGNGLLLIGTCGTGKTHLAAAITNHIISEFGIPVKFGTFIDLLSDVKSTFDNDSNEKENDIIDKFVKIDLLVIDDIGKEKNTEWSNSILYRVINRRYENYKPVIITSNLTIAELEKEIGEATVSRIIEMCDGVKMNGKDARKEKLFK